MNIRSRLPLYHPLKPEYTDSSQFGRGTAFLKSGFNQAQHAPLTQDVFHRQPQFGGAKPIFSENALQNVKDYFEGIAFTDAPPADMEAVYDIVQGLLNDRHALLEPRSAFELADEHNPQEKQLAHTQKQALRAMAGDILLDKTQLKQPVIDSLLLQPPQAKPATEDSASEGSEEKPSIEKLGEQIAAQAQTSLSQHYPFTIPVSKEEVMARLEQLDKTKLKQQAIDAQLLSPPPKKKPQEGTIVERAAKQAAEVLKKRYPFEIPLSIEDVEERMAAIDTKTLRQQAIDAQLLNPLLQVSKEESVAEQIARQTNQTLARLYTMEIPVSPEDVEQRIAFMAKNKVGTQNKAQAWRKRKQIGLSPRKSPLSNG